MNSGFASPFLTQYAMIQRPRSMSGVLMVSSYVLLHKLTIPILCV